MNAGAHDGRHRRDSLRFACQLARMRLAAKSVEDSKIAIDALHRLYIASDGRGVT